ncbi:MAG: hypothetical protein IT347_13725 [Candidatus Eisenbacteria bacterium]|nr:hypothetical protein [Candidatus Eisenbacteria bacterium]
MMRRACFAALFVACMAVTAHSGTLFDPEAVGFTPRVPVSALARPAAWFDPARLHMSSTIAVGSGWGTTSALQTTSFLYQFRAPVTMAVTLGNELGTGGAGRGASFFLQGLDLSWKPSGNSMIRLQFQDLRSPLQYGHGYGNGSYGFGNPYLGW